MELLQFLIRSHVICLIFLEIVQLQNGRIWSLAGNSYPICNSRECHELANIFLKNLNERGNPCSNFYQYVCHGWEETNPRPKYSALWTVEASIERETYRKLKNILEDPNKATEKEFERVKLLYRTCMNTPFMEKSSPTVLRGILTKTSAWPLVLPKAKEPPILAPFWQLEKDYIKVTGESALFDYTIAVDVRKPNGFGVTLKRPSSPYGRLWRYTSWNKKDLRHYTIFLNRLVNLVVPDVKATDKEIKNDLDKVIAFREQMRKIISQTTPDVEKMTIREFQQWCNLQTSSSDTAYIDWLHVIRAIYKTPEDPNGLKITSTSHVYVQNNYFTLLIPLLARTPPRVIANHIHLYFVERHLQLDAQTEAELKESITDNFEPTGRLRYGKEKWRECLADNKMKNILGKMFVKSYFTQEIKNEAENLINTGKRVLGKQISESSWLDSDAKQKAIKKLNALESVIGYPYWYNENTTKPFDASDDVCPIEVEVYYEPTLNRISISAAYFQMPVFSLNLPYVTYYAATLSVLAHELMHAFDIRGVMLDEDMVHKTWWSFEMFRAHRQQAKCFVGQYQSYRNNEFKKRNLNLPLFLPSTLNEDIADVMGLKVAYQAYREKLQEQKGVCPILPGFQKFGCDKLFFIAYANIYCASATQGAVERLLHNEVHNLHEIRVNGAVSNMKEFSTAFGCKPGDPMVLQKTCDLWKG